MSQNFHRQRAKEYALHYFRLIGEKAGVRWNFDNDSEIEAMVDSIIEAAKIEILAELRRRREEDEAASAEYRHLAEQGQALMAAARGE